VTPCAVPTLASRQPHQLAQRSVARGAPHRAQPADLTVWCVRAITCLERVRKE
jgi:hypothetical protein